MAGDHSLSDARVGELAGAHDCARRDGGRPVQPRSRKDAAVRCEGDGHVDRRRAGVHDGRAPAHPALQEAPVHLCAQSGELDEVVASLDQDRILDEQSRDSGPGPVGGGHDVGQVELALGVGRVEVRDGPAQEGRVEDVGGRVDLADVALFRRGVPVFDDAADLPRLVAEDAPVAGGVRDGCRQHRHGAALVFGEETGEHVRG